jgi:predicted nucleic acid-binding protein
VRLIVSDTGPVLHLIEAHALNLLHLAGEVHIPVEVHSELAALLQNWQTPGWLLIDSLDAPHTSETQAWQQAGLLDIGEAAAIALARQINADWLLTDDAAARLLAGTL